MQFTLTMIHVLQCISFLHQFCCGCGLGVEYTQPFALFYISDD